MWKRILKYLIGAVTIVTLVIGTQIVTAETGLIVKPPKPITNIASEIGQSFTLGMVGVAYATTPDYICDGVADDVEIQAALNALPATGGELFFFGGNYVLTATVTRAINNVSIVGSGYGTYFANDGGTAIFSNGAQTGWHFENFRTDAGWMTLATACTMQGVWDNTAYVDTTMGTGATLPTHPRTGQNFMHTPTGRSVRMVYDGTNWLPMESYGTYTVYVDSTDGTDGQNYGYAVDAGAYKTIQYAINQLPETITAATTIYVNEENYAEDLSFIGKQIAHTNMLMIQGTMISDNTGLVATGGTIGAAGANPPTITAAIGLNEALNHIIRFTSGVNNGLERLCAQNPIGTIYLQGSPLNAAPAPGDTFDILDWGTTIQSFGINQQDRVGLKYFTITGGSAGGMALVYSYKAFVYLECVNIVNTGTAQFGVACDGSGADVSIWYSRISTTGAGPYIGLGADWNSNIDLESCKVTGNTVNSTGIRASTTGTINIKCTYLYGNLHDAIAQMNGVIDFYAGTWTDCYVAGGSTTGCLAQTGGQIINTAGITYGINLAGDAFPNGANENAIAASYGYID